MFLPLDEERQKGGKRDTAIGILGLTRPRNDSAGPGDMDGVQGGASAPPGPAMVSGIPRIEILDENAVYDHYMRRLNRVWMRRIKASRRQGKASPSRQQRTLESTEPSAWPMSVPSFIREMGTADVDRRRRRLSGDNPDLGASQSRKRGEAVQTGSRPRSAPLVSCGPHAAWVELRDRNHAATGPGPTSSRHRRHHGDGREDRFAATSARPGSAPALRRHLERDTISPSRGRSKRRTDAAAWLAPRLNRLERETHDLLTACRKAGRDKGAPTRWKYVDSQTGRPIEQSSPPGRGACRRRSDQSNAAPSTLCAPFRSDEKLEDLGRGAVVRLIGNLGMGRYAHRFRAFAITGSDLASCTEEDLVQIGVVFRPHRIRLMREIKRRKGGRGDSEDGDNAERGAPRANPRAIQQATVPPSARSHDETVRSDGSESAAPIRTTPRAPSSPADGNTNSPQVPELHSAEVVADSSSSTSKVHTTYNELVLPFQDLKAAARTCPSPKTTANRGSHASPRVTDDGEGRRSGTTDVGASEPSWDGAGCGGCCALAGKAGDGHDRGGKDATKRQHNLENEVSRDNSGNSPRVAAPSGGATERATTTPPLKGTLQVSGVRTDGVKMALGGSDPFLRVSICNQLRRTKAVAREGVQASWDDAVLSFSVTEKALAKGGVQIDLCDGGIGARDSVASGTIPGDATLQLMCCVRSNALETGQYADNLERSSVPPVSTIAGGSVAVELRLFTRAGGEDAGVCTLTMDFRPDDEGVINVAEDTGQPKQSTQIFSQKEVNGTARALSLAADAATTAAAEVVARRQTEATKERQSSLSLLEETAKHIETIEEVCQLVRRQYGVVGPPEGSNGQPFLVTEPEQKASAIDDEQDIVEREASPACVSRYTLQKADAAIVLQSHTRRRAAGKVAKKRVKERTAAKRVQAFARQRMAVGKVREAREREILRAQRRVDAAVRLQRTARGRIAVKAVRRRQSDEEAKRATQVERERAAANIQGFVLNRRHDRRENRAATKVQGIASVRKAKAELRRRKREKRKEMETAAASRIQTFTRRQRKSHESRLAQLEMQRQAAVKIQRVARYRNANAEAYRWRDFLKLVKTAARVTVADVLKCSLEHRLSTLMEERRRAAAKIQILVRERAAAAAAEAEVKRAADKEEAALRRMAAQKLQVFARSRSPPSEIRRALAESLCEVRSSSDGSAERESHAAAVKLQATARKYAAMKTADSLRREEAMEVDQRVAAECIQGLYRRQMSRRTVEHRRRLRSLLPSMSSSCVSLVTQELKESREETEAAMCIQRVFRDWYLTRQATAKLFKERLREEQQREEAVTRIQRHIRAYAACKTVAARRHQKQANLQELARRKAAAATRRQNHSAVCIQRSVRMKQAGRVDALRKEREIEAEIMRELELSMRIATEREAAECIQRAVRMHQAKNFVVGLMRQKDVEAQRTLNLKLEGQQLEAASCIQRSVRVKQASGRVDALRKEREIEAEKMRELERSMRVATEREAAVCIQRATRSRHAVKQVNALRLQRSIDTQHDLEVRLAEQTAARGEAAMCIQRAVRCRQALLRVTDLRRQAEILIEQLLEEEEMETKRLQAVTCIQCAARSKQAIQQAAALRHDRDAALEVQRELIERNAAVCIIQRAARQALDVGLEKQRMEARSEAAACIQRAVRCKQAWIRASALRQQRGFNNQKMLEEKKLERKEIARRQAATCIQRAVRKRHAIKRVSALRRQRDAEAQRSLELQLERETSARLEAAECLQRAARTRQAATRREATECIQRVVRVHQAVKRTASLKRQRDTDNEREKLDLYLEEDRRTASKRKKASVVIQRCQRRRAATQRVEGMRQERTRQALEKHQQEVVAEQEAESVSSVFAKMIEAATRASAAKVVEAGVVDPGSSPALLPNEQQQTGMGGVERSETLAAEDNIRQEAPSDSSEFDSAEDGQDTDAGEGGDEETWGVVDAPDGTSDAFDGATPVTTRGERQGRAEYDLNFEGRSRLSSASSSDETSSSGTRSYTGEYKVSDTNRIVEGRQALEAFSSEEGTDEGTFRDRRASSNSTRDLDEDQHVGLAEEALPSTVQRDVHPGVDDGVDTETTLLETGDDISGEQVGNVDDVRPSVTSAAALVSKEGTPRTENEDQSWDSATNRSSDADSAAVADKAADDKSYPPTLDTSEEATAVMQLASPGSPTLDEVNDDPGSSEHALAGEEQVEGWESHLDEESGRVYFYHAESGVTSWDDPRGDGGKAENTSHQTVEEGDEVRENVDGQDSSSVQREGTNAAATAALREGKSASHGGGGDENHHTHTDSGGEESGVPHVPEITQATQGESVAPELHLGEVEVGGGARGDGAVGRGEGGDSGTSATTAASGEGSYDEPEMVEVSASVDGGAGVEANEQEMWEELTDPDTGDKYFYNSLTRQSTWGLPDGVVAAAAVAAAAATGVSTGPEAGGAYTAGG